MKINIFCVLFLLMPLAVFAKESRCGWLENPSPANYWFTDKDGEWTISIQGDKSAIGMEKLAGFPDNEFIQTNVGYGYGCACITIDTNFGKREVIKIYKFNPISLQRCKSDKKLKNKTSVINELEGRIIRR